MGHSCQSIPVKELDEETALINARLAKILQHTDYDAVNKRVIPWLPHRQ